MGISALLASQILDASATGRSVLTGADASAIRTTLGLGTLSTQSPTGTPSASTFLRGDFSWQTIDLSGYVPYSGATGAVNLGANALTAGAGTFSGDITVRSAPFSTETPVKFGTSGLSMGNTWGGRISFNYNNGAGFLCAMSSSNFWAQFGIAIGGNMGGVPDLLLERDSAATLGIRNSTNAQRLNLYGTYTDASNYRRLFLSSTTAGAFTLGVEGAGTGASGNTLTVTASELQVPTIALGNFSYVYADGSILALRVPNGLRKDVEIQGVMASDANGTGLVWRNVTGLYGGATAHILEQRFGTNAQTFRIYNLFTDASNYERAKVAWESNVLRIGTEKAGTGSARALELQTDGTTRLTISTTGAFTIANALDIAVGTTTGTKIGTATTQKLGFFNATPVVQPTAVANATDAASVITQLNALLSRMRDLGLIAT